ncbi:hypothetical protein PBI_PAEDORE_70 [Streptomyces phage Paedore]|uniref:DUF2786 domain-containing protein n=1 Tax=Streptomyces phage Paedore TaxID=2108134 RepID=A0A2P1JTU6_9CAUD|nr:hypothetical protein KGG91_gp70 [Streptomyces phage Paedore]AVO22553.1 hypothetical protein PBI_PAEDORE_70 [Streptomyces phage Paedore]
MTEQNPKAATIRALLAKAEDPATHPEEAEAYFAKAAALMAKYGIEQAMLADSKPSMDKLDSQEFKIEGKYVADRANLLFAVSHALGAQNIFWNQTNWNTGKRYKLIRIYAHTSTLARIDVLFTTLQLQALNGMKHGRPQYGESTTAYRKSWFSGFSSAVRKRLQLAEASAVQEAETSGATGAELVLVKREQAVEAYFKGQHPGVKPAPKRRLTGTGWRDGVAAGANADLGSKRVGGSRPALAR